MDHLILFGADYKEQTLAMRERLSIPAECVRFALQRLVALPSIKEAVLLGTCNRFEIYAVTSDLAEGRHQLQSFFTALQQVPDHQAIKPDYVFAGEEAVEHLFRVTSGLESMVLGEGQIVAQVKEAYRTAVVYQSAGSVLKRLFELALHCGKRVRSETTISRRAVSTAAAAVELAGQKLGSWRAATVLIIGAGRAGQMCLKQLLSLRGPLDLTVVNRDADKFDQLRFMDRDGRVKLDQAFASRHSIAAASDVVFVTTSAPAYVLNGAELQEHLVRTSCIIDLSVPRNVDPAVGLLAGVDLFTVDDLAGVVRHNLAERAGLSVAAESIIKEVIVSRWRRGNAGYKQAFVSAAIA